MCLTCIPDLTCTHKPWSEDVNMFSLEEFRRKIEVCSLVQPPQAPTDHCKWGCPTLQSYQCTWYFIPNIETVLKAPWQLDPLNRHGMLYELNPENVLILAGVHKAMQMMLLVP